MAYADVGKIIDTLSKARKLIAVLKSVFKKDGNLDFNISHSICSRMKVLKYLAYSGLIT